MFKKLDGLAIYLFLMKFGFTMVMIILISSACNQTDKKETIEPENLILPIDTLGVTNRGINIYLYKIGNCEYIGNIDGYNGEYLTHNGECKNPIHKTNYKSFFKK